MKEEERHLIVEKASLSILFSWSFKEKSIFKHLCKFNGADEKIVLSMDGGKP